MTRTTLLILALFAVVDAGCIAFGIGLANAAPQIVAMVFGGGQ